MFEGYLELGGNEIVNSARSAGYLASGDCPTNWIVCPPCPGIPSALGDIPYTLSNIASAPWYDEQEEASHRFLGVHALSISGLMDSTRTAQIAEGVVDGGVVGQVRHAVRQTRVRALLSALGEDALESGLAWLKAALDPEYCGIHGSSCGATDSCFFVACPPTPDQYMINTPVWNDPVTNLVTNPSFETAGAAVVTATNLATNPSFETAGSSSNVVIATNLATNPSMEATGVDVEVRRNLLLNPRARTTARWSPFNPGGGTTTPVATGLQMDFPTDVINQELIKNSVVPAIPNSPYNGSVSITVPTGFPAVTLGLNVKMLNSQSSIFNSIGPSVTVQPNSTVRIASLPASHANETNPGVQIALYMRSSTPGARIIFSDAIVEKSEVAGSYFDGSTPAGGDFTHLWTATPDDSASVQNAKSLTGVAGPTAGSMKIWQTSDGPAVGSKAARYQTLVPGANTYLPVSNVACVNGQTYTVVGRVRPRDRDLSFQVSVALTKGPAFLAPMGVWTEFRGTLVAGGYNASYTGLFYIPGAGGDLIDIDAVLIADGDYTGPYFDGTAIQKARRNLHPEPQLINTIAGYTGFGDIDFTAGPDGIRLRSNSSSTIANPHQYIGSSTLKIPVSAGDPIVASVEISVAAGQPGVGVGFGLQFIDKNGGGTGPGGGAPFYGTDTFVGPGETKRAYSPLITVPPNTTAVMIQWYTATTVGLPPLAQFLFRKVIIEPAAAHGAYFDGSHPVSPYLAGWDGTVDNSPSYLYDPAYSYAWTGTPDASSSTQSQTLETVAGVAPPTGGQATVLLSSDSPAHGTKVMRYTVGLTGGVALPVIDFMPTTGIVYTLIGKVRPRSRDTLVTPRIRNTTGPNILAPKDVWTDFRLTTTAGSGTITQTGLLLGGSGGHQVGDLIDIDQVMVIEGGWNGPYFDGNTVAGGDFTYGWTGAPNASTSTQRSTDVAQAFAQTPAQTVRWQSPLAASERGYGARYRVVSGVVNTPLAVSDSAAILTGTTYTILGRIRPLTNEVTFRPSIRGTLTPSAEKITAPVGVWTKFQATIVAGSSTMKYTGVNLDAGHKAGDIIDLDQVAIIQGNYTGDYFDGATPDSPETDYEIPDQLLVEYAWTGTADASTSTGRTGSVAAVPDPVAYEEAVDLLQRTMHDVTCISGPLIEQKLHRNDMWGYIVEFTLAAGTPWLFGTTREVVIPPGQAPIVVQDVPFNLVPYPSAELSSGTVVVATNYATNPSLELDATGWVTWWNANIPATFKSTTRTSDISAAGSWAYESRLVGNSGATPITALASDVTNLQTPIALSGGAGARYSFSIWASMLKIAGGAGTVLTNMSAAVHWLNSADAIISATPLGVAVNGAALNGTVFAGKSLLPPAGAVKVRVAVSYTFKFNSSAADNSDIRFYADALAVTVP